MSTKHTLSGRGKGRREGQATVLTDQEALEKEPNGSFAWKVLAPSQVRILQQCETPEDLQEKMAGILNYDQHEVELKEASQLDYFVTAFHWANKNNFDERQLSGFMTLVTNLLQNIKEIHMSKAQNLIYLKECFSGVGSDSPDVVPIPLYFFKLDHAKQIMEYLMTTLFHHYSLYEYLFTQEQGELILGTDLRTEVCPEMAGPFPPPLEEGMLEHIYDTFCLRPVKDPVAEAEGSHMSEEITDAVLKAVESSEVESVKNVPAGELRKIIDKITKEMILPTQTEIKNKIKDKEQSYLSRISKIHAK